MLEQGHTSLGPFDRLQSPLQIFLFLLQLDERPLQCVGLLLLFTQLVAFGGHGLFDGGDQQQDAFPFVTAIGDFDLLALRFGQH